MGAGPVFIGGPDRCGKTTMRAFLVSHPNISIPAVGSNMWTYFYGQFGDLGRKENFERCLDAMIHYKHIRFLNPDPDRIRKEFRQGPPGYARLFALFQEHHAEREGKPRWGDQTGLVERYADEIFSSYPAAKMIHLVRDPRDRYEASLALWPNGRMRVGGATARWLYSTHLAHRNLRKYPDRYKIVHFEKLILETEQTLREVCVFLGEEYTADMIEMKGALDHREKLIKSSQEDSGTSPLSIEFIGRYRKVIPKQEIAFMQAFAGRLMKANGYQPDSIRFSPNEHIHYILIDFPLNFVRMKAWLGLEFLQHHFPAWMGRKPARKMIVAKDAQKNLNLKTSG
ncbi:MAG: sulfotransferase [Candidatus Methanosuratincola sp.]